jgi:hypothetical protein
MDHHGFAAAASSSATNFWKSARCRSGARSLSRFKRSIFARGSGKEQDERYDGKTSVASP